MKKIMSNLEQTLSIIKPDAVARNLVEEIKNIFKKNNLNILESKKIKIIKWTAEFYKVHQSKPFTMVMCYLSSGPIVVCIEGNNAIILNRKLMGATNPKEAAPLETLWIVNR